MSMYTCVYRNMCLYQEEEQPNLMLSNRTFWPLLPRFSQQKGGKRKRRGKSRQFKIRGCGLYFGQLHTSQKIRTHLLKKPKVMTGVYLTANTATSTCSLLAIVLGLEATVMREVMSFSSGLYRVEKGKQTHTWTYDMPVGR